MKARIVLGYLVALAAIGVVGFVSWRSILNQREVVGELAALSRTQRALQDADMEHDNIRAELFALMLANSEASTPTTERLDGAIAGYRGARESAMLTTVSDDLRQAIVAIGGDVDAYLSHAAQVGRIAVRDQDLAQQWIPEFQATFDRLAASGERLTDVFAQRVQQAETDVAAATRRAAWLIVLACLGALAVVAWVSRLATLSVARALGSVQNTAQRIAGGDVSVRVAVPVQDEIGQVGRAVNAMADSLQGMISRLQSEQENDAFSRQLSESLEMADTEAETHAVVARAMAAVVPSMPMELLVSDSSKAHLERATSHPSCGAPGCIVDTPYACMAVRRGNPIVFDNSEALNACSKLQARPGGAVSAVCVPISFMGKALGVLHATGPVATPPSPRVAAQLTTLGILAGSRIGTVRAFQKSQLQASTDGLTGLSNRRSLETTVRRLGATPYAVVLADLDRFKQLNDTHGHDAGDRALKTFAGVLRSSLRAGDYSARWGGEEFVIVLERREAADAVVTAERIRQSLALACASEAGPLFTASFGIADTTMGSTFDRLIQIADDALYQSKESGRDRATIGDPSRIVEMVPRRPPEHLAGIDVRAVAEPDGDVDGDVDDGATLAATERRSA